MDRRNILITGSAEGAPTNRKEPIMANTTANTTVKTLTRAEELSALLTWANANGYEGSVEKLEKVHAQWTTPRVKSSEPSKASKENSILAERVYAALPDGVAVDSKWIVEHVSGIMTPQKLTHVMSPLVNGEKVRKDKVGKVMTYTKVN